MSTELPPTARDQQLRRMLVATASAAPATRPRRRGTLVAVLAAFTAAGALAGGAVSAAAINSDGDTSTVNVEQMAEFAVYDAENVYGTPFILTGKGNTNVELGVAPDGAQQIAVALRCTDAGSFTVLLDGQKQSELDCTEEASAITGGGGGSYYSVTGDAEHTLTIQTDRSNGFVLWASWATRATKPSPSASQQLALSDGVVTDVDYRDGFARYNACMIDAGHPLNDVDDSGVIIRYSNTNESVMSGVEGRCYAREFEQLDMTWQSANQTPAEQ